MREIRATVNNKTGLHARPAASLIKKAKEYKSEIWIIKNNAKINAKSMLSLLSLGVSQGDEIVVGAEGEDEETAVAGIVELINGFVETDI